MPRKRPKVLSNPDKPITIDGDSIQLFRKITPKTLMNQYVQIPRPPKPVEHKPINYVQETTNLINSVTSHTAAQPMFKPPASPSECEEIREKARSLLIEPVVSQSLLQERFENKKFPNHMKAMCYTCGKDIHFMDDFFIHAAHVHGAMLHETVDIFIKLIDKIEKNEKGQID